MPFTYFLLLFALSIPFYLFGGSKLPVPVDLPVSALAALLPAASASILIYRQEGLRGVKDLFKQTFDYGKIKDKRWLAPLLLLNPLIYSLSYAFMRLARLPLPDPIQIRWQITPAIFAAYFFFAATEELGWTGYALEPLQKRFGALKASLLVGSAWALFHLIPDFQNRRPIKWIFWHRLGTISLRVIMVWFYNRTGKSVFSSILLHDTTNVSWTLFPNYGSHYNPKVTTLLTLLAAGIAILFWRPRISRKHAQT